MYSDQVALIQVSVGSWVWVLFMVFQLLVIGCQKILVFYIERSLFKDSIFLDFRQLVKQVEKVYFLVEPKLALAEPSGSYIAI